MQRAFARFTIVIQFQLPLDRSLGLGWLHFINLKAEGSFTYLMGKQTTPVAKGDERSANHGTHKRISPKRDLGGTLVLRPLVKQACYG